MSQNTPVFSKRAVTILPDLLKPRDELPRLDTKKGEYFLYNILTKSTDLDASVSQARIYPDKANGMDFWWFDEVQLEGHAIFRIREFPARCCVF